LFPAQVDSAGTPDEVQPDIQHSVMRAMADSAYAKTARGHTCPHSRAASALAARPRTRESVGPSGETLT
jgi:hypothetical protein